MALAYLVLAWVLDPKPDDLFETKEEDEFWKDVRTKPKSQPFATSDINSAKLSVDYAVQKPMSPQKNIA